MAECKIEAIKIRKAKKSPGYGEPGLIWVSQGGGTLKSYQKNYLLLLAQVKIFDLLHFCKLGQSRFRIAAWADLAAISNDSVQSRCERLGLCGPLSP
jgi:hypothetical protein